MFPSSLGLSTFQESDPEEMLTILMRMMVRGTQVGYCHVEHEVIDGFSQLFVFVSDYQDQNVSRKRNKKDERISQCFEEYFSPVVFSPKTFSVV